MVSQEFLPVFDNFATFSAGSLFVRNTVKSEIIKKSRN